MRLPLRAWAVAAAAAALTGGAAAQAATDSAATAALGDLGLAMLRQTTTSNAVVSPVAVAAALGMVHAGTQGAAEREIEALFGAQQSGPRRLKQRLPALLQQLAPAAGAPASFVMAGRVWMDSEMAAAIPAAYTQRLAQRYQADAARVSFKDSEATRSQINSWTADKTAGRIKELMPPGSVSEATQLTLTTAMHFRSPWQRPFDVARTEPRNFHLAGGQIKPVPTLNDERAVLQAEVNGSQVLALPFADETYTLLLAQPAKGRSVAELLQGLSGAELARWQTALQAQRCALALPKFALAPKAGALRPLLESLGVKTVFTTAADLRPMLGRQARAAHLGEVFHAAGIQIDEQGGEAVAAAAATVQSKSLVMPAPACAVDRPFVFVVLHRATGTPLFMGRVGDPTLNN